MAGGDMAKDNSRGRRGLMSPCLLPPLLKPLLLLVVAACLTGEVMANWPPCKSQCDTNFTKDDIVEHPGIKSVCHRGCELFTVALISTPRGGVPLVGTAFGQNGNFDITPEVAHLMGVSEDILKRIDNKNLTGKKMPVKSSISNWEKAKKQKQELEQKIVHQMDSIGKTSHVHSLSRKQAVMDRMEQETHNIMHRLAKINAEKEKDGKSSTKEEKVIRQDDSAQLSSSDVQEKTIHEKKKTLGHDHNEKKQHEIKIETINGREVITFDEDIDCEELDELERMLTERKGLGSKAIIKSKNNFQQVVNSKISDAKPIGSFVLSKKPQVTYKTVTGETARKILEEARQTDNIPHTLGYTLDKVQPNNSKQQNDDNTKEKTGLEKSAASQQHVQNMKAHGPVPLVSLPKRPTAPQTQQKANLFHDPLSKTTVQPLSHPVQDHPVHANRQITTDSSDANERKTTTPKSSNPVAPVSQRVQEFGTFSLLANKLGLSDKKHSHPLLHLSFFPPKPLFSFEIPQQISIIEIVKKKNNIDFEKLHQEHLKEAAQCPMIHERFEQAKHSCRHACATAFKEAQEQDACVVGCQIQETSSTKQVKALTPPPKIQNLLQRTTTTAHRKPDDVIVRPGGLLSSFSMMFSNLAGKIGQSMHKMWNNLTHRKSERSQEKPGRVILFKLHPINKDRFSGGNGSPSLMPELPGAPALRDSKTLGLPAAPHLGVQIFFKNIETGHNNPNIQPNGRPHERIINTETIFQFVDNRPPKSEAEVLKEQMEHHEKLIQHEMEREGNLLAQTIEMGQGGLKSSDNELNHQIEILGKHLNEEPRKTDHGLPIIPKFIADFLFPKSRNFEFTPLKDHAPSAEEVFEKNEMKMFDQLFRSKSTLDDILRAQENSVVKKSHSSSQSDDDKSQSHDGSLNPAVEEKVPVKSTNSDCQTTSPDNVQIQQLDLLDCISRKSGLPRWLIGITVFASALVVFYLCFSLSTPVDESKLGKPKATTVVMCERLEDDCSDDDCCEKKKLLPETDVLQIRLETV